MKHLSYKEKIEELDSRPLGSAIKWTELRAHKQKYLDPEPKLGMFIPCKDGKPLELSERGEMSEHERCKEQDEYQQALSEVLFEGFELQKDFDTYKVVSNKEDLRIVFYYDGSILANETPIKTLSDLTEYELTIKER